MSLAVVIEFGHALAMIALFLLLPFLFWHRWPALSMFSAIYNLIFVVINRLSHWGLGECILTRAARWAGGDRDGGWFTVKFSRWVFGCIPSNKQVVYVEQALIVLASVGVFWTLWYCERNPVPTCPPEARM